MKAKSTPVAFQDPPEATSANAGRRASTRSYQASTLNLQQQPCCRDSDTRIDCEMVYVLKPDPAKTTVT
eukprot:5207149-Amphidinium_carterae.2